MDKQTFICALKEQLKKDGFRKQRNYWYKKEQDLCYCIFVQGSQWDKNDYYVEIGIDFRREKEFPTVLDWSVRQRCRDQDGKEQNISPSDLSRCMTYLFGKIKSPGDFYEFARKHQVVEAINQFHII